MLNFRKNSGQGPQANVTSMDSHEDAGRELEMFQSMMDCMPVNVMVADPETLNITYVNKTSIETLRPLEHLLPVKADDLLGACIDIFHKNPSHQRQLLANPANLPHTARITLGDEILDLLVSPIFDRNGSYVAPVLTWSVVTEAVKKESAVERMETMVDNMPINVMMCDPETLEMTYINQTSVDTLQAVKHLLPAGVDPQNMLGVCIDVFHKEPSMQRRMLADPNNMPHNAKIALGPETLDLKVSAVMDANGGYIGPMVTWSVVTAHVQMIADFETNVKSVVDQVAAASTEMRATAESMAASSEESVRQSNAVAAAAEEATANVQTVASASEELSSSISEISRQVSQSSKIAQEAVQEAERTNETVQGLAEASTKIGEVVNLINDIASQTNLLALNATIEAARAGEAGKGFAVVASEVKNLANQTARATEDISSQIAAIQQATTGAVEAIQGIGKTIDEVNEIAGTIAAAVEEQGAATNEISRNVQEAATGTQEVSQNIQGVSQAANEAGQGASEVLSAAEELSKQSEDLGNQVDAFLVQIKKI
jgi:methyl-accepting chemotaxis protein